MKRYLIIIAIIISAVSLAFESDAKKPKAQPVDKEWLKNWKSFYNTSWFNLPSSQPTEVDKLNKLIQDSSSQSADMQSYIAFFNAGVDAANEGDHESALSYYYECRKIIGRTSDIDLRNLYTKYGWKKELDDLHTTSYTQFKLKNPGKIAPGEQASQSVSTSGDYSAPYTPSQHPNYCGICNRTGKCTNCNGTGISPYSKSICGACGGDGKCKTCGGSGISGYSTY